MRSDPIPKFQNSIILE